MGVAVASGTAGPGPCPKGTPEPGESREETALREVAEETGLEVRITGPLDSIEYWFVQGGQRIHKTVHYFLMEPTGGDLAGHDHEFEQVRWITFAEASTMLTFETERMLVARAGGAGDRARARPSPPNRAAEPPTGGPRRDRRPRADRPPDPAHRYCTASSAHA